MKYGWHATFMRRSRCSARAAPACIRTSRSSRLTATRSTTPTTSASCRTPARPSSPASSSTRARSASVFAQWVNSYKRLVPGFEAPVYCAWSRRNRSALVQVPLYTPARSERRAWSCAARTRHCNPYLTFAILLAARAGGDREGLRAARADGERTCTTSPLRSGSGWESSSCRRRSARRRSGPGGQSELVLRTFGEHIFNRYVEIKKAAVGGLPGPGDPVGAGPLPVHSLAASGRLGRRRARTLSRARRRAGGRAARSEAESSRSGARSQGLWRQGSPRPRRPSCRAARAARTHGGRSCRCLVAHPELGRTPARRAARSGAPSTARRGAAAGRSQNGRSPHLVEDQRPLESAVAAAGARSAGERERA